MKVIGLSVGPLQENTYLVFNEAGQGAVIDPGDEPQRILSEAAQNQVQLQAVLLTHAHFDHVGAVAALVEALQLPVYLHPLDLPLYRQAHTSAARWGIALQQPPEPTQPLSEGQVLDLGLGLEVLHLPGHAPGHVGFYHLASQQLLSGDVLFRGGIGRYDLPGSSLPDLQASLQRLGKLPPQTKVYPGHGPITSVGHELQTNPYLTKE